MNKKDINKK